MMNCQILPNIKYHWTRVLRLHQIADMMDQAIAEGATADEAEALAIEQLRELGSDVLTDWAQQKQEDSLQKAQKENPSAIGHIKKK